MKFVKLVDICTPKQWKTIATSELTATGYPVYGANGVIGYYSEYNHEDITLMITCRGATCGTINLSVPKSYITGNSMCLDNIDKSVNIKYLYYALQNYDFSKVISGSAQPQITREGLKKVTIPLVETSDQEEIIKKLDKLTILIEKRKNQINKIDILVKSQFIEMFGDAIKNDKCWVTYSLNYVAPAIAYKGKITHQDNKFWLLNLDMVEAQTGDIISKVMVNQEQIGNSTIAFNEDNILYSKLRPYLNKVVIPYERGFATSELVPLKPQKDYLNRIFFATLLRSDAFVGYIQEQVAGAKMPRVSMDVFRNFKVICPPLALQNEFARFVEQTDKSKIPDEFEVAA